MNSWAKIEIRLIVLVFLVLCFISCNEEVTRPIKYVRGHTTYDCTGFYNMDKLERVLCYNEDSVLILKKAYKIGTVSSFEKMFYDTGELKEEGQYAKSSPVGVWKYYYPNGELKEYEYYKLHEKVDSSDLIYKKIYDTDGFLDSCLIPVKVRHNSLLEVFRVGTTYELYIDLLYSEFDSVKCAGILNAAPLSSLKADSTMFLDRSLQYSFTPIKPGQHTITGTYFEINANHEYKNERNIAERPFKFEYVAE